MVAVLRMHEHGDIPKTPKGLGARRGQQAAALVEQAEAMGIVHPHPACGPFPSGKPAQGVERRTVPAPQRTDPRIGGRSGGVRQIEPRHLFLPIGGPSLEQEGPKPIEFGAFLKGVQGGKGFLQLRT